MSYDPNDFQDQAAIAAMLQRQRMINSQNQQQNIPKNRKCPWCGGLLPGQYSKCQHCSSDVSWVDGLPCKPQDADYLREKSLAEWKKQQDKKRRLKAEAEKLRSEIAARVVKCKKCTWRVPQTDLINTVNTCEKCADVEQFIYRIKAIAVLTVIVTLIIGLRAQQEKNQLLVYINVAIAALTVIGALPIVLRTKHKHNQFLEAMAEQQAAEAKFIAEQQAAEAKPIAEQQAAEERAMAMAWLQAAEVRAKLQHEIGSGRVGATLGVPLLGKTVMLFAFCPAGSFTMGSPAAEDGHSSDENQVSVTLSKAFWMAKTEVTQAQWMAIMGNNPSSFNGYDLPVESVSWDDAQKFIKKVNDIGVIPEGWKVVLPTEAQWEYAARAGGKGIYAGIDQIDKVAWYHDNSDSKTHPVGMKKGNSWGLHDMSGNVWEWCSDWYGDMLPGGFDPTGPFSGSFRVIRGGSWNRAAYSCRAASRRSNPPSSTINNLGFRLALSSVP